MVNFPINLRRWLISQLRCVHGMSICVEFAPIRFRDITKNLARNGTKDYVNVVIQAVKNCNL